MIPESKIEAVERGLLQAFGTTTMEEIRLVTGGLSSALVYRIVVGGEPYILRLVMHVTAFNDPARQYACMNIAAEAGIAPRVWYSNAEDAVSITDFVTAIRGPVTTTDELLIRLADRVRAIHSTVPFPRMVNYLDAVDYLIKQFRDSAMLPESSTEEHFRCYSEIQRTYPRHDPDLVSSHNDLNRRNILFTDEKIWIIDWEASFLNDRFVDLAIVANGFISNDAQENVFLKAYFGETPHDYIRARFFLMRQVCHMFYAMVLMSIAASQTPGAKHDTSMETMPMRELYSDVASGRILLESPEGQILFAKASLNEALRNMKTARFAEAIGRVAPVTQQP